MAVVGLGFLAFQSAGAASYECSTEWVPQATAEPAPGATPALGYVQQDLGRSHIVGSPQRYTLCPPASGSHRSGVGIGPIQPRVYGPDDRAEPMGWIHNLEHGGLVLLYRYREGDPARSEAVQAQLRDFFGGFPNSPVCGISAGRVGPVVARFDEMATPFAAVIWNRVFFLDEWDAQVVYDFFLQQGEQNEPEPQCPRPTPGGEPSPTGN